MKYSSGTQPSSLLETRTRGKSTIVHDLHERRSIECVNVMAVLTENASVDKMPIWVETDEL